MANGSESNPPPPELFLRRLSDEVVEPLTELEIKMWWVGGRGDMLASAQCLSYPLWHAAENSTVAKIRVLLAWHSKFFPPYSSSSDYGINSAKLTVWGKDFFQEIHVVGCRESFLGHTHFVRGKGGLPSSRFPPPVEGTPHAYHLSFSHQNDVIPRGKS